MRKTLLLGLALTTSVLAEPAKEYTDLLPTLQDKLDAIKAVVTDDKSMQVQYNDYDAQNSLRSFVIISYDPKTDILELTGRNKYLDFGTVQDHKADGLVSDTDVYLAVLDGTRKHKGDHNIRLWVKGPANQWDIESPLESKLTGDYAKLVTMCYDFVEKNKK